MTHRRHSRVLATTAVNRAVVEQGWPLLALRNRVDRCYARARSMRAIFILERMLKILDAQLALTPNP